MGSWTGTFYNWPLDPAEEQRERRRAWVMTTHIAKGGQIWISSACFARIGIYSTKCLFCSFDSCCLGSYDQVHIRAVPDQPGALQRSYNKWGKIHAAGTQGSVGKCIINWSRFLPFPITLQPGRARESKIEAIQVSTLQEESEGMPGSEF